MAETLGYTVAGPRDSGWVLRLAGVMGIVLLGIVAYGNTLHGSFIWNDDLSVWNNPTLNEMDGLHDIWFTPSANIQYLPLTYTSFWIEKHLWRQGPAGDAANFSPAPFKATNLVLHLMGGVMLWVILRRLAVPAAWVIAVLFVVHPLQVESVAWVSERTNVLSGFFYFASILVYVRYCGLTPARAGRPAAISLPTERNRLYAIAFVLFALSLASKTTSATLPVAVALLIWWKRGSLRLKDDLLPLLPMLVVGALAGVWTAHVEKSQVIGSLSNQYVFAPTAAGDFLARFTIAGRAIWFYVYKLLVPTSLSFSYVRWPIDSSNVVNHLPLLAAVAAAGSLFAFRKKIGRGPAAAMLFFLVTIFPALGFVNVSTMRYSFVADHFQYVAGVGVLALVCGSVATFAARKPAFAPTAFAAAVVGVAGAAALAINHGRAFAARPFELWNDVLSKTEGRSALATASMGSQFVHYAELLKQEGRDWRPAIEQAQKLYERTIRLDPTNVDARANLGYIAGSFRDDTQAEEQFYRAALAQPGTHAAVNLRLAELYFDRKQFDQSASELEAAVANQNPCDFDAKTTSMRASDLLGQVRLNQSRPIDAIAEFNKALELDPELRSPLAIRIEMHLADALLHAGRSDEAESLWQNLLIQNKDDDNVRFKVLNDFGLVLASQKKYDEALQLFSQAAKLRPKSIETAVNLGQTLLQQGRNDEAAKIFRVALSIDPKDPAALRGAAAATRPSTMPSTVPSTAPTTVNAG